MLEEDLRLRGHRTRTPLLTAQQHFHHGLQAKLLTFEVDVIFILLDNKPTHLAFRRKTLPLSSKSVLVLEKSQEQKPSAPLLTRCTETAETQGEHIHFFLPPLELNGSVELIILLSK